VQQAAGYTTATVDEDGVAQALREFKLIRWNGRAGVFSQEEDEKKSRRFFRFSGRQLFLIFDCESLLLTAGKN
jgi:hypothetical protein